MSSIYVKSLEEVDQHLDEHRAYLKKHCRSGLFIVAGRKVPRTGGMIFIDTKDRAQAEAIVREDPFVREGVATYELIEFTPTMASEGFSSFM